MSTTDVKQWLANHPRATMALITLMILCTQAGMAAAGSGQAYTGP